ncbi:hypothetical protein KK483_06200 [Streptomyces sp. FIT100]|nr:hypothetical protein KK483_06200 [Streptomyces sp. FIT100]
MKVVGSYVHTYDPSRQPYPSRIPSATPIYDALCSEYRRAFRALPGDRSGEEDLGFKGFGALLLSAGGRSGPSRHLFPVALPPAPRRGL